MLRFYGSSPGSQLYQIRLGGVCPHCKTAARYSLNTPVAERARLDDLKDIVVSYSCDNCLRPIPVQWKILGWPGGNDPKVGDPKIVLPAREPYDFEHVPDPVRREIEEALDCLSVNAFNGFAALCRRTIQAIATDLGAGATAKVKTQIEEMIELSGLDKEWKELAVQIMLSGHNGSHPHLPEVNAERAVVLLSLLRDLTYQLYTRPGKVREAAALRQKAIDQKKT